MKGKSNQFELFVHSSMDTKKRETLFNDIWEEYYPKLTVYLKTAYPGTETEDLVQDIMLKVYKNLHSYNPLYSFNTWIYTIARNCAVDSFRKKYVLINTLSVENSDAVSKSLNDNETPEKLSLKSEVKTGIEECISTLPRRERQISYLQFLTNFIYKCTLSAWQLKQLQLTWNHIHFWHPESEVVNHLVRLLKELWGRRGRLERIFFFI